MNSDRPDGGRSARFANDVARVASIAMGLFFALLGFAQMADGRPASLWPRIFGACLAAFGLWFAWRGFRSATVIVGGGRVVTRSFLKSHSYPIDELVGARVENGRTGLGGFGRDYLVLERRDGSVVLFKEINARAAPVGQQEQTVVQAAARAIGEAVDA